MKKLIFVTGGVCSSLGKGISASSIGCLLESRGLNIRMIKIDPYLNVDAGTMSPYQHGEVYVTDDGAETDLDLGNYARFTNAPISRANSITTGQIYRDVINKEREGRFLGRTVQVVPHITDEIKNRILAIAKDPDVDVTIVEIGGTVGDIESIPFLEAARQLIHEYGRTNAVSVHVTLIPEVAGGEMKTKPTQHAVKELQEVGIQPDVLVCRSSKQLDENLRRKLAMFTNIEFDGVISAYDVDSIYEIPLIFHAQGLDRFILQKMNVESRHANLNTWREIVGKIRNPKHEVKIGVVGKYMELVDAYKSVWEALNHAGIANDARVTIIRIDSSKLERPARHEEGSAPKISTPGTQVITPDAQAVAGSPAATSPMANDDATQHSKTRTGEQPMAQTHETDAHPDNDLESVDGILVPGGFGERGINGMVYAAQFAREHNLPYFGICLGMQIMAIEWARNVLGWKDADSTEFNQDTPHPVVSLLEDQVNIKHFGGTMRLGSNDTIFKPKTKPALAYGKTRISERHRHRYEFSNSYRSDFERTGLIIAGTTEDEELVECLEWPNHIWGVGVQYHPEFKSSPTAPHPLFVHFVKASLERKLKQ
ncbi:MAG TPA: CTP synthase [Spirochaetia bacterium]|nr:CTP synthase [Spirochaetales bacterium]HQK33680.1 CTP synthase [Spirochaetales bacterium]HRS65658.1 CTP synthase [Spirochaetia bacterium]HRV28465.1 CTP synthase [Spirochaetia bacterium]